MKASNRMRSGGEGHSSRRSFLATTALTTVAVLGSEHLSLAQQSVEEEAQQFLARFVPNWLALDKAQSEASWLASTDVSEAHDADVVAKQSALDAYVGSKEVIDNLRRFLKSEGELKEVTVRQLRKLLLMASEAPGTISGVVETRNRAEVRQASIQDSFKFTLPLESGDEVPITANQIDSALVQSNSLPLRRAVWESSKAVGRPLRSGLIWLRELRNRVAREMGYDSFFALQVADYGMTADEMVAMNEGFVAQLSPLYKQLHTWTKYELASRFGVEPPKGPIPAHWLPNRWGQNWPGLVSGIDLDAPFAGKPKEFIIQQAESFYVSMGFPKLPKSFFEKSDLYPVASNSTRQKNGHASAWHIDLEQDVRSLQSIEPNSFWFTTAHHELGHIYYYLGYSNPQTPHLVRQGANRAFHEGIGDLIGLAASQPKYLADVNLLPQGAPAPESIEWLLEPALSKSAVVFIPFAAGTMTRFERDFYAGDIPDDAINVAWWEIVRQYQGITPPDNRPDDCCDPATKTHVNDDPAQYYDYALGTVIKFQLHDYIAREILKEEPRNCSYFGHKEVGAFLGDIFALGATRDWRSVLKQSTGSDLSAAPMLNYFAPLLKWLEEQNKGREIGW